MSDYVISRRRSRPSGAYAVDPCLGYYVLQPNDTLAKDLNGSRKSHSSTGTEDSDGNNAHFLYNNCIIPSSLSEEHELDSPTPAVSINLDHEEETTDWVELIPSRPKHVPCLPASKSPSSAAPNPRVYQNTDVGEDQNLLPLTVEGFLKQSSHSKSKAGKTYRVKKIRALKAKIIKAAESTKTGDDSQPDGYKFNVLKLRSRNILRALPSEDDPSYVRSSPFSSSDRESSSMSGNVKGKLRNPSKTLKERIYEAAITTHVEPEDDFAQDEPHPTRSPLHFVPGSPTHVLRKRKKKSWTLVDPRKSKSISTATFASSLQRASRRLLSDGSAGLSHTLDRLPIEIWKWDANRAKPSSTPHTKSAIKVETRKHAQNQVTNPVAPNCPPLMLVPMNAAASDYAALFRRKRESTDNDKKAASKRRKQELSCPPNLQFTPLPNRSTTRIRFSKYDKGTADKPPTLTMVSMPNATTLIRSSTAFIPPLKDMNHLTALGPEALNNRQISSPIEPTLSARTSVSIKSMASTSSVLPFLTQQTPMSTKRSASLRAQQNKAEPVRKRSIPDKPLRPLESFMDEFLKNIRHVNEQILESQSKDKCPRPSTIAKKRSSQEPCLNFGNTYEQEDGGYIFPSSFHSKAISTGSAQSGTPQNISY